jgi:hypothetical protein
MKTTTGLDMQIERKQLTSGSVAFIDFPFHLRPTRQPICISVGVDCRGTMDLLQRAFDEVGPDFDMSWQIHQFGTYEAAVCFTNESGITPHLLLVTGPAPSAMIATISLWKQDSRLQKVPVVACHCWNNTCDHENKEIRRAGADGLIEFPSSYDDLLMITTDLFASLAPVFEHPAVVRIDPLEIFEGLENVRVERDQSGRYWVGGIARSA